MQYNHFLLFYLNNLTTMFKIFDKHQELGLIFICAGAANKTAQNRKNKLVTPSNLLSLISSPLSLFMFFYADGETVPTLQKVPVL